MVRHLAGLSCILLLAVGSPAGSLSLGSRVKDETNGFQFQIPAKWEQVPTKFQDVALIGKWSPERAKRDRYPPECEVLRFLRVPDATGDVSPREAVQKGIPGYAGMLRYQPRDVWDFIKKNVYRKIVVVEDEPEFKMSSKKFKAHLRVYRQEGASDDRRMMNRQSTIVAAQIQTVEENDTEYGVVYSCADSDAKDMVRTFKTSIKRFRILDSDEEDEDDEGGGVTDADIFVSSEEKPELWRAARKRKLEGLDGWDALDTENYLIVYNKEVKKPLLKAIAKQIEAIRGQVYAKLFPPAREMKAISVVRVCKDKAEYHRYGGPGGSAGYWSRGDEELVFYQDKSNKKDSLRVLYHEAFHQYIHYAVGDVAPHSWFNEGHGDYFAGHNYRSRKFKSDVFRWRTGIIANALAQKTYVPLDRFLKYTQGEYYANPGLCYAQGWSLIYFLREVEARKIKKYEKYFGLLDRYFEAIKRNVQKVKDEGIDGLNDPPDAPPDEKPDESGDFPDPPESTEPAPVEPKPEPGLPRLPGLEQPFPGENADAGAGPAGDPEDAAGGAGESADGERRTVAGPKVTGKRSALDTAVDEVFLKNRAIDIKELEKDWVEWSKKN